ncbi:hypothetical protein QR680_014266 [Steinernema hermaphroditum]|uniref:Hexosyltransferase n=1 Tax=Steinernema hermaphroditum TaxID=289476 RepID=A0AA39I9P4_9BILA|nr:hypothetical protein QR680_014266 [Steinernema hermaphroditum]
MKRRQPPWRQPKTGPRLPLLERNLSFSDKIPSVCDILDRVPLVGSGGRLRKPSKTRDLIFGVLVGLLLGFSSYFVAESDVEALTRPAGAFKELSNHTSTIRCVVLVQPHTRKPEKYVAAVKDTYGKQCNETLYFTTSKSLQEKFHEDLNIFLIDSTRSFDHWTIFHHAVDYVNGRTSQFDWTIVVNEQSYVILNNLRRYVHGMNPNIPTMVGKVVDKRSIWTYVFPFHQTEAFELDAGVLMSSTAFRIVASRCAPSWFFPRYTAKMLRKCSSSESIQVTDPVDEEGLRLFHANSPMTLLSEAGKPSAFSSTYLKKKAELHCCSDSAITFGGVKYRDQRMVAYAVDSIKVYGVNRVV